MEIIEWEQKEEKENWEIKDHLNLRQERKWREENYLSLGCHESFCTFIMGECAFHYNSNSTIFFLLSSPLWYPLDSLHGEMRIAEERKL